MNAKSFSSFVVGLSKAETALWKSTGRGLPWFRERPLDPEYRTWEVRFWEAVFYINWGAKGDPSHRGRCVRPLNEKAKDLLKWFDAYPAPAARATSVEEVVKEAEAVAEAAEVK